MVPLLPKLRGQFAEFLNHSSPDRLSILYLTTCVGYGYGPYMHSLEAFLDSTGSPTSTTKVYASRLTHYATRIYLCHGPHAYTTIHYMAQLPHCVTPSLGYYQRRSHAHHHQPHKKHDQKIHGWLVPLIHHWAHIHGYQNINWLSIDYACRPRLRSRLTLGRLA